MSKTKVPRFVALVLSHRPYRKGCCCKDLKVLFARLFFILDVRCLEENCALIPNISSTAVSCNELRVRPAVLGVAFDKKNI